MKGLTLEILRGKYDSTNGGITSKARGLTEITVVNLGKDAEIFEPTPNAPAFRLEMHVRGCLRLVPVHTSGKAMIGPMFGGNYAVTSDSRFARACEKLLGVPFYGAVAVHDRFETQQDYDALSR